VGVDPEEDEHRHHHQAHPDLMGLRPEDFLEETYVVEDEDVQKRLEKPEENAQDYADENQLCIGDVPETRFLGQRILPAGATRLLEV
jgi:hypothetical protein